MRGWLIVVSLLYISAAAAEQPVVVRAISPPAVVYEWATERCEDNWIPDAPARAYRRTDGSLVVMATHYTNGILRGRGFDDLKPDCAVKAEGAENPDPAAFDDRFWTEALVPGADGKVIALVSHEYLGARHPGHCEAEASPGPRCWYSSLLLAESDENSFAFKLLQDDRKFLAAPPAAFDPKGKARIGFFTTSNVIRSGDDWLYMVAWVDLPQLHGNCLFRASAADPTGGWYALHNGVFDQQFLNPYTNGAASRTCDIVGKGGLLNILRSVVWLEHQQRWLGVYNMSAGGSQPEGIYYTTSIDLINWSAPNLLFRNDEAADARGCKAVYQYPSLIDHGSSSKIFDTASDDLYLYMTRFNQQSCRRGLDRDLVRVRLNVSQ